MLSLKYVAIEAENAETINTQPIVLVVTLALGNAIGIGEVIIYDKDTLQQTTALLEAKRNLIERYALTDPKRFWHFLHHLIPGHTLLIAALDSAGWDLFAQLRRLPLYKLLNTANYIAPTASYTLVGNDLNAMIQQVKDNAYTVYNLVIDDFKDITILTDLQKETDATFRLTVKNNIQKREFIKQTDILAKLKIELIEYPFSTELIRDIDHLASISNIPLYATANYSIEKHINNIAALYNGIIIKPSFCGGITPTLLILQEAKTAGLEIMLSAANETIISTAAILHLMPQAAKINPSFYNPNNRIQWNIKVENGKLEIGSSFGLGLRLV